MFQGGSVVRASYCEGYIVNASCHEGYKDISSANYVKKEFMLVPFEGSMLSSCYCSC